MADTPAAPQGRDRSGGFCTDCGHEVESFDGLNACPACGSSGVPCAWANQVTVQVNWHELRILAIWAENWARQHGLPKTVYGISRRLEAQWPDAPVPLTLAGELGQLAGEYNMSTNDPGLRRDIAEQTGREVRLERRPRDEDINDDA